MDENVTIMELINDTFFEWLKKTYEISRDTYCELPDEETDKYDEEWENTKEYDNLMKEIYHWV